MMAYYSAVSLARAAGVSRATIVRLTNRGLIGRRIEGGRGYIYNDDDLERVRARRRTWEDEQRWRRAAGGDIDA